MTTLILGCGYRDRRPGTVGLDINPDCHPDVLHDLETLPLPLPFLDEQFDRIEATHVLEHVGRQGDWRFWFAQWAEFWRLLAPGGIFAGVVPSVRSVWAWGDPGHSRIVTAEQLQFLRQPFYTHCVGNGSASDYRAWYKADFDIIETADDGDELRFVLRAVKPARLP